MAVFFSNNCRHALRAVLHMALRPPGGYCNVRCLAHDLHIPSHTLSKLCQNLAKRGLLNSCRGPKGGFTLARDPEAIHLLEIVEAVDGLNVTQDCVLGVARSDEKSPCPLHSQWCAIRTDYVHMLADTTIAEMARGWTAEETTILGSCCLQRT